MYVFIKKNKNKKSTSIYNQHIYGIYKKTK